MFRFPHLPERRHHLVSGFAFAVLLAASGCSASVPEKVTAPDQEPVFVRTSTEQDLSKQVGRYTMAPETSGTEKIIVQLPAELPRLESTSSNDSGAVDGDVPGSSISD